MIETAVLKGRSLIVACALLVGATVAANASSYTVTLQEVVTGSGTNVVATGSGQIDLFGLLPGGPFSNSASILPSSLGSGPQILVAGGNFELYQATISGPTNFGMGGLTTASSSSGDPVGFNAATGVIAVPITYTSLNMLSSTSTYDNTTFALLAVTPGTYVWAFGNGLTNGTFTLDIIAPTPLPAALPLFAAGLGLIGLAGWRRKRKAQAV